MTKQIGPEQEEILKPLGVVGKKLARIRKAEDLIMTEAHDLIRNGFARNISGLRLSKASGLSLPRVYQIRQEVDKDVEQTQTTTQS